MRFPLAPLAALAVLACAPDTPVAPPHDVAPARALPAGERTTAAARWQVLTRTIIGRREFGPLGTSRTFALVAVAQYDAVVAARAARAGGTHPSEVAAAAAAARHVLATLYPAEQAVVGAQLAADAALAPSLASERDADWDAGLAVGLAVGQRVMARAATDGSTRPWTGAAPVGPGYWRSAPPPAAPLGPTWGEVRPWVLDSVSQFRPAAPPAFGSPEFAAALAEVHRYSDAPTPAQLQVAAFWQGGSGPGGPIGWFASVAAGLVARRHMGEAEAARTFALLQMAMMDVSIACWDAKYAYWYVRPYQADPTIRTPVGRPNFPAYPSGHSCFSAAAAGVLASVFPDEADALWAQVAEAGDARLYAGLHYQFDIDAGRELGLAVARQVLARGPRAWEAVALD